MAIIIAIILVLLMSISLLFSGGGNSPAKLSGYECGLEPMGDAKVKLKI